MLGSHAGEFYCLAGGMGSNAESFICGDFCGFVGSLSRIAGTLSVWYMEIKGELIK